MFKTILISIFVLTLVFAQKKTGDCPPFPDVGECRMTCFSDVHCRGIEKCCRTACGGTFCTRPVTERQIEESLDKPGYCPLKPTGPWVCSSRCAVDADCRGTRKCCKNRCGALACTKPATSLDEYD